ncbi:MAG: DUF2062 domain-containing protein [Desulfofustis sp.]|nr:DUF2062 domain-containing protein [Desulfofustis sp.]NNF45659.1 DUF2062 domain-containing protein [Desulfofustis sp.]NNK13454.1 DUF2062 domain-containing protein [Desulfofustis sp.]NNK58570.1 DUF2062 domain-containing protein [Desulfofustis sp.]
MTLKSRSTISSPRKRRIIIPFRAVFKWLVRLRRSPRAVAGGFALGMFLAFTPTIGFQLMLAVFWATVLNLNRPAAMLTVWITNVATMAPIYTFNYWVGSLFWSGPPVFEVYQTFAAIGAQLVKVDFWDFGNQFETILGLSSAMAVPLVIGSVLVGLIAAALTYLGSLAIINVLLTRRQKRQVPKGSH